MNIDSNIENEYQNLVEIANRRGGRLDYNMIYYVATLDPLKALGIGPLISRLAVDGIEVQDDLGQVEPDAPSLEVHPFDPSLVNIICPPLTIDSLIKRIKNKEIEFASEFQRKAGLWTTKQKSQLIESILLQIPLPAFYFDATNDDKWIIIDGLQRTTAIKEFIVDETLVLSGMEFFSDLDGHSYSSLPRSFQRRIEETHILAYKVCSPTPPNVKFNIFKRINTGGLLLTAQEIRNALFQGKATRFLNSASKLPAFTEATAYAIEGDRMLDREFVLRFIAFCYLGLDMYFGDIDTFLNNAMEWLNSQTDEMLIEIRDEFVRVMKASSHLFGVYAFRKMGLDGKRRPINKAVFSAWCSILHNMDRQSLSRLIARRNRLHQEFITCCENRTDLWKSNDRTTVMKQFSFLENMVNRVLL
jgi:hypothetical protein